MLARGRLLLLDGPSVRTLQVNLDEAMEEDSDQGADLVRISGKPVRISGADSVIVDPARRRTLARLRDGLDVAAF